MYRLSGRQLILLPLLVCACYSWSPVRLAPTVAGELPPHSRVVRKGGKQVTLYTARVTADSIIGSRSDSGRIAISRDSVARVEERHFRPVRTLGVLAGVSLGVIGALFLAFLSSGNLSS